MKYDTEVQLAWKIASLIDELNTLFWDRYDKEFVEICLNDEQEEYPEDNFDPDF